MELTFTYILSQVLTIIVYILIAITYQLKKRKNIVILSFSTQIIQGTVYFLLNAYTALAMRGVAAIRDLVFWVDENKNGKSNKINTKDILFLIVLYVLIIIFTIITLDGWYSLLSATATMLSTYSIWQKNVKIYKILGIPTGILWIVYNFLYKSIFGVILESLLLLATIRGVVVYSMEENMELNGKLHKK